MRKLFLSLIILHSFFAGNTQVKIGDDPANVNGAALLQLSNNKNSGAGTWKSFLPPEVDFTNNVFTSVYVWGIAGSPVAGAIVYNTGESYANGFSGPGLYCWQRNSWAPFNIMVTDRIRLALSTSRAAYDAAEMNNWVIVTANEYNNLLAVMNNAGKYGCPEIFMNTSSAGGWSSNYTIGGNQNLAKIPASSYVLAWSVRTGSGASNSLNSKLKYSTSQTSGYADYGNPLPNLVLAANTRTYFVIKTPNVVTPALPCFTAVYNASTYFLGNISSAGAGPEYYVFGDNPNPSVLFGSDSYSQVISTNQRQW